ncbi:MAG: hypothetical protein ABEK36_01820, partial [Candidatus Aenigmatarchaeota archaeon]
FKYPSYFSWGTNYVGSEDYKPMDTGEVDVNANNVAQNINVWAYKEDDTSSSIWSGTLYELYTGSNAIPQGEEIELQPGDYGKYQFKFELDSDVEDNYQNDGVEATFEVEAVQEGQE